MLTVKLLLVLAAFVMTIYSAPEARLKYLWIAVLLLALVALLGVIPIE